MNDAVLTALIELVKQGGQLALWGIFIYFFLKLLIVVTIGGFIWLSLQTVSAHLVRYSAIRHICKEQRVTLLSKEISGQLTASLNTFLSEVQAIVKGLNQRSEDSTTKSTKK